MIVRRTTGRLAFVSLVALVASVALAPLAACSHKKDDGTTPSGEQKSLPPLTIRDDTRELLLTWIDEKGETHVEVHPASVPANGRSLVRVLVADQEDGTRDLFYVADLSKKRDDGSYATRTMPRREWEAEIQKRRSEYAARNALAPSAPGTGTDGTPRPPVGDAPKGAGQVIIYGASWCGPCHQAEAYFKSKGVPAVMKDIEETPGASAEMREKLERSGQRGGSIPVIDVRGQVLVGFSAGAIDRALAKTQNGTVL